MSAKILDGRDLAKVIKNELKAEIQQLKNAYNRIPNVVNILIGNDAGSCAYARSQQRVAADIGLNYRLEEVAENISQTELIRLVNRLNNDPSTNGIMLHRPVPQHIDYNIIANCVDTSKDLEGINVTNIGKMMLGETQIIPCTPASVMAHIKSTQVPLRGAEAVVVGHSGIVGKPLALMLLSEMATVTVCHLGTSEAKRLDEHVGRADILVVAVGHPGVIPGEWIKPGAVVIDVGINQVGDQIVGDVEFETAVERAGFITPVPGGVGRGYGGRIDEKCCRSI
jgi:methylenetetrahydrofolate dehydrogenase (NADP+)/methenyltetrahydrofolate cyclohydrolase